MAWTTLLRNNGTGVAIIIGLVVSSISEDHLLHTTPGMTRVVSVYRTVPLNNTVFFGLVVPSSAPGLIRHILIFVLYSILKYESESQF